MLHEDLTDKILRCAYAVHSALGPGLLESTYGACRCHRFAAEGLRFGHQVRLPVRYDGIEVDAGYRIDFLVEDKVIVELKAVEKLLFLHKAQVITYLRLSGRQVGLLINFNVAHLKQGIQRVVNGYPGHRVNDLPDPSSASSVSTVVESSHAESERSST